jgi:transcriptional regulator MftR-like protein
MLSATGWPRPWAEAGENAPGTVDELWRQRTVRSRMIMSDEDLRARARAGYAAYEDVMAAGIGEDLGQAQDALAPRLAAVAATTGLRELLEVREASGPQQALTTDDLLELLDRVLDFVRAGLAALDNG